MEKIFRSKNQGYWRIKQGLDGNRTKMGGPKVADIENNTVAFPYIMMTNSLSIRAKK